MEPAVSTSLPEDSSPKQHKKRPADDDAMYTNASKKHKGEDFMEEEEEEEENKQDQREPQQQEQPTEHKQPMVPVPDVGEEELLRAIQLQNMRLQERQRRPVYDRSAKGYLKHRRQTVKFMLEVGRALRFHRQTIHTAVKYMDHVMLSVRVARNYLNLVGITCVFLATKYEEKEIRVPRIQQLRKQCAFIYSADQITEMEIGVLKALDWNMGVTTPVHFLHYYVERGILFTDDTIENQPISPARDLHAIEQYVNFFSKTYLKDYNYQMYLPSVIAAAIVAAARKAAKLDRVWNSALHTMCGYEVHAFYPCYDKLWKSFCEAYPQPQPSQYVSPKNPAQLYQ